MAYWMKYYRGKGDLLSCAQGMSSYDFVHFVISHFAQGAILPLFHYLCGCDEGGNQ